MNSISIESDQTLHEATPGRGLHRSQANFNSHITTKRMVPRRVFQVQADAKRFGFRSARCLSGVTRVQTVCVKSPPSWIIVNRVPDIILFLNVDQNSGNSLYTDQNQKRRTHVFSFGINFVTCGKAGTA